VLCLDARNAVRFSVAGNGKLIDNLGTARGSREVQLANGRAEISVAVRGACMVGISSNGIEPAFLQVPSPAAQTRVVQQPASNLQENRHDATRISK
jgi:beta-galactosidase